MRERLENLRSTIAHHNHQYYVLGDPEIPDSVYDQMFRILVDLEKQYPEYYDPNSPTARVGSDLRNNFPTVDHLSPMLSISAVQTLAEIEAFSTGFDTICQLKYDGVGVNLIYRGGKLYRAITRGDGFRGVDVTTNVRAVTQVPYTINTTETVEIRGEVWCPWSELRRLKALGEEVKSPIAVAINSIKMRQSSKAAKRHLTFTAFSVIANPGETRGKQPGIALETHLSTLHWLSDNLFNVPYVISMAKAFHIVERNWCNVNEFPNCHDVHADGLVFKHNDLEMCEGEGYSTRTINWAISWKFDKDIHEAVVAGIGGKVALDGRVTPLVFINPLVINHETISKIPVPMLSLPDIKVGQTVKVRRMGTRVAQIIAPPSSGGTGEGLSLSPSRPLSLTSRQCPQCGSPLEHRKKGFYCTADCQETNKPPIGETYQYSLITKPEGFSTDPAMYQYIARVNNCRLIPIAPKSNKFRLYYNDPSQLAAIGSSLGEYARHF